MGIKSWQKCHCCQFPAFVKNLTDIYYICGSETKRGLDKLITVDQGSIVDTVSGVKFGWDSDL